MTPRQAIWIVAMREIRERARSRVVVIAGVITLLALVAAIQVLPRLVDSADGPPTYDVGVVGEASAQLVAVLESAASRSDVRVRAVSVDDVPSAEAEILAGDFDAAFVDGRELLVEDRAAPALLGVAAAAAEELRLLDRLAAAGLSARRRRRRRWPRALVWRFGRSTSPPRARNGESGSSPSRAP